LLPRTLAGVTIVIELLGCVDKLRYSDCDVRDMDKFLDLLQQVYLERRGVNAKGIPIMEPKQWIHGLYNTCIMNLLEIPNFGRGMEVNNYIKKLITIMHRGILWLDTHVSIDVDLIAKIIGLPTNREQPMQYLDEKIKEKALE
jgi:hypothetical protein